MWSRNPSTTNLKASICMQELYPFSRFNVLDPYISCIHWQKQSQCNLSFEKKCYKLYWCQFKQLNNYYYVKFFVFIGYKLHKLPEETTSRVRLSTQHLLRGGSRGISEGAILLADEVSKGSVQILHLLARALWSRSSQRISVLHYSVCWRHFQ